MIWRSAAKKDERGRNLFEPQESKKSSTCQLKIGSMDGLFTFYWCLGNSNKNEGRRPELGRRPKFREKMGFFL